MDEEGNPVYDGAKHWQFSLIVLGSIGRGENVGRCKGL